MASLIVSGIGFIGAGRLGTALAWSFAQHGLRVVAVASMIPSDAERLAVQRVQADLKAFQLAHQLGRDTPGLAKLAIVLECGDGVFDHVRLQNPFSESRE